jgi:uncharacterized membrane protein
MENTSAPDAQDIAKGKTNAILAYCTLIGWIIGFALNSSAKTKFATFHLRQGLGLTCVAVVFAFISIGFMFSFHFFILGMGVRLINLVILVFSIIGIINASNGKMEPLPVVGEFFNNLFSGIN